MSDETPRRFYTYYFWLDTGQSGTVYANDTNHALDLVKNVYPHSIVKKYGYIPYPATPDLLDPPPEWKNHPRFCYSPSKCVGKTACPKMRSCAE